MYRSMGSIAFVAAARSSWLVSKDPKEPNDRRLFTKVKNNLASEDVGGLAFRIGPRYNGIMWEDGKVETTADEALRVPERSRAPMRASARDWLKELLKDGPVLATEVWEKADADGMAQSTVKTAKQELGIGSQRTGGTHGEWRWLLPKLKKVQAPST